MPLSDHPVSHPTPSTQHHPSPQANSVYEQQAVPKLMEFLHGCLSSPPKSTLINAITKNYLRSFQGLFALHIRKFLPKSEHTTMCRMNLLQKGLCPTSKGEPIDPPPEDSCRVRILANHRANHQAKGQVDYLVTSLQHILLLFHRTVLYIA